MSTVPRSRMTPDAKIVGPLDHLRGTIRRYVLVEGLLLAALFVVGWFALGMLLDYGLFKASAWDWVLDAPAWVRTFALVVMATLLVLLIASRVFLRLTKDFSYSALALVLERRFPKTLGDRLITAVELADVNKAASYGYSSEMITATIEEARNRVGQLPVRDVFNWARLWKLSAILAVLVMLILGGAVLAYSLATTDRSVERFFWRSAHVTTIWAERNFAMMNTPWPRQAHLEYVDFPGSEMRVAKDATLTKPVGLRVRAYKWVIADPSVELGWRPMLWTDVPGLLKDETLKQVPITRSAHAGDGAFTVDQIEYDTGLTGAIARLNALADDPANARTLRRLEIPNDVKYAYEGSHTRGDAPLKMDSYNEFVGELKELKESVEVAVWADDYRMPLKQITLVPSPMLSKLVLSRAEPAYLHHAPPAGGTYDDLKGLRQRMTDQSVSPTGERSDFTVPAGTEITLSATSDKPLKAAFLRPKVGRLPGQVPGTSDLIPLTVNQARDGFATDPRTPIPVTDTLEFDLIFDDVDGIRAVRPLKITKQEDAPPSVGIAVDGLRKEGSVYLATPQARVPFIEESKVSDDRGLSRIEYVFEYSQVEAPIVVAMQGKLVARLLASAPGGVGFPNVVMPAIDATLVRVLSTSTAKRNGSAILAGFNDLDGNLRRETKAKLVKDLEQPLPPDHPGLIKDVVIKNPNKDFFDIGVVLKDLVVAATEVQPRYRIDLNVQATDTNVENETGPKKSSNVEPIRLMVISEADLLVEISKDEEKLIIKLDDALRQLREGQRKLSDLAGTYTTIADSEIIDLAVRGVGISQDVAKTREMTAEVLAKYRGLLRECEINRMQNATIDRFRNEIVAPLDHILERGDLGTFRFADQALGAMQAPLNATKRPDAATMVAAVEGVNNLVAKLQDIRDKLGESLNISKLRDKIQEIRKNQQEILALLNEYNEIIQRRLFTPDIRPAGPVALAKGESKKIKHAIDWKLFDKDDLPITLQASDRSLTVPAEVKVPADQLDFEYEVKAGQTAGEFTITVQPAVGKAVVVRVNVK